MLVNDAAIAPEHSISANKMPFFSFLSLSALLVPSPVHCSLLPVFVCSFCFFSFCPVLFCFCLLKVLSTGHINRSFVVVTPLCCFAPFPFPFLLSLRKAHVRIKTTPPSKLQDHSSGQFSQLSFFYYFQTFLFICTSHRTHIHTTKEPWIKKARL